MKSVRYRALLCCLALLSLYACAVDLSVPSSSVDVPSVDKHRGVNFTSTRLLDATAFDPLLRNHVDWIALTPFGWQLRYNKPEIELRTTDVLWSESDEGLRQIAAAAHTRGIKILLKPHIWLIEEVPDQWRGTISFISEVEWQRWESDYRNFVLHYARLAAAADIEMLSIGVELHFPIRQRPAFWHSLIAEVRSVYAGQLTYGANWYREYEEVSFWDELDYIGVHAYFPLTQAMNASVADLEKGWEKHLQEIESLQRRHDKPVLFTEIGYRSVAGTAIAPWDWTVRLPLDMQEQVDAYEALFRTFWDKPWFAGVYIWNWTPDHSRAGGTRDDQFSPQNKPAEAVLARWFGQTEQL